MNMNGKVYGRHLNKVKYVVKGRKLKSSIATFHIKEEIVPKDPEFEFIEENNIEKPNDSIIESIYNSFEDDDMKSDKKKMKVLKVTLVALAIMIVVGIIKVGSMFYTENDSENKTVSNKESIDNEDNMSNMLLGASYDSVEEIDNTDIESTIEPSEEPSNIDEKTNDKNMINASVKDKQDIVLSKEIKSNSNNQQIGGKLATYNNLVQLDKTSSATKTTTNQATSQNTNQTNDYYSPITSVETSTPISYTKIANASGTFNVYHVTSASINAAVVRSYKYSKAKVENGEVLVPSTDVEGMWFMDDGPGLKVIAVYSNGSRMYANTVYLYEKAGKDYALKTKYYVLDCSYIELNKEYSTVPYAKSGKKSFYIEYDTHLYSVK